MATTTTTTTTRSFQRKFCLAISASVFRSLYASLRVGSAARSLVSSPRASEISSRRITLPRVGYARVRRRLTELKPAALRINHTATLRHDAQPHLTLVDVILIIVAFISVATTATLRTFALAFRGNVQPRTPVPRRDSIWTNGRAARWKTEENFSKEGFEERRILNSKRRENLIRPKNRTKQSEREVKRREKVRD